MHDASSLGVIAEFDIASLVPIDDSATFAELSEATGLDEDRLSACLSTQRDNIHVFFSLDASLTLKSPPFQKPASSATQ